MAIGFSHGGDDKQDAAKAQRLKELERLGQLANEQLKRGDLDAVVASLNKALAIEREVFGPEHSEVVSSLESLGRIHKARQDLAAAQQAYEQALAIRKKTQAKHVNTALISSTLAMIARERGDYTTAQRGFEDALAIYRDALGERHSETSLAWNNLGVMLQDRGDYARARPYLEKALALFRELHGEDHARTAAALSNLGMVLYRLGDSKAADSHLTRALELFTKLRGERHADVATALNNLAALRNSEGNYEAAKINFEKSLAISESLYGQGHPATALAVNNLGSVLHDLGDHAKARSYYLRALKLYQRGSETDNPRAAGVLNNLGMLARDQANYAEAAQYLEQAVTAYRKTHGESHADTAMALTNLGGVLYALGKKDEAKNLLEQGLGITQRSLDLAAVGLSERQQLANAQNLRFQLDTYLSVATEARFAAEDIYKHVLGWKGAILVRQQQIRRQASDPKMAPIVKELQATATLLANLTLPPSDPKRLVEHQKQVAALSARLEELQVQLARGSGAFQPGTVPDADLVGRLQAALAKDVALVDFLEYTHHPPRNDGKTAPERRLLAFIVRNAQPISLIELGPTSAVTSAIDDWRRSIAKETSRAGHAAALKLRRLVWEPLQQHLRDTKTVLVSPDGTLATVSFAALPGKEPSSFLLEEIKIAVVPVPRLLATTDPTAAKSLPSESLLLVGGIDYGEIPAPKEDAGGRTARGPAKFWESLEATRVEVLAVRDTFENRFADGKVTMLRDKKATESAFRLQAPSHRWLHVASHGFFAVPQSKSAVESGKGEPIGLHPGLLSGLVFAGANLRPELGKDDGILTALEVAELDLRHVELAVLSACETGLGEVAGGEGLLGLQRSFQIAGARSVVSSLWSVDDEATRKLMARFYENHWRKSMTKLDALHEAQLWMLREGVQRGIVRLDQPADSTRRTPPFFWAAFVLSGDWR